ncbi:hypothetical protein R1sor_002233 [Riccia sorocarpa]|uniref:POT1A/B-like OB fold domain-containing protein n=1 Tax=Riccia sorocarpa TaxID=122646 RepID=A0ABD3H079_9MARC
MKVLIPVLALLILVNVFTGSTLKNRFLKKAVRKIISFFFGNDYEKDKIRFQHLHEQQCRREPNRFSDSYNKTLYSYANSDTDGARVQYAIREMLERRFPKPLKGFSSSLKIAELTRKGFMVRLEALARNVQLEYDPRVLQELIPKVKSHIDKHYRTIDSHAKIKFHQRYNSCAVVGNSGELLNATYGNFIDEHDAVIRINNAKPSKWALSKPLTEFIGGKTTIMFMNSHVLHLCSRHLKCQCHPYGSNVSIVLYLCNAAAMLEVTTCAQEHKSPLLVTDRRFDLLVTKTARWYSLKRYFDSRGGSSANKWRLWELLHEWETQHKHEFHYSTGMQAVVFALATCQHVDLLGFGKNPRLQHHFHSPQKVEHYSHDFEAEYIFYQDLAKPRKFHIFAPWYGTDAAPRTLPVLQEEDSDRAPLDTLEAKQIPLPLPPRDVLCDLPPVGTMLPIIPVVPIDSLTGQMPQRGDWVKFRNLAVRTHAGMVETLLTRESKISLLSTDAQLERILSEHGHLPQSSPKPRQSLTVTDFENVQFSTLREVLTHEKVTCKFRCLVRVISTFPTQVCNFCVPLPANEDKSGTESSPVFVYGVRFTLEDPTGRLHAFLFAEDGAKFFNGHPAADLYSDSSLVGALERKVQKLLGYDGRPAPERDPPWIKVCLKSYYTDESKQWESRCYRIFGTTFPG